MAIRFASSSRVKNRLPRYSNFWDGTTVFSPFTATGSYDALATYTVGAGGIASVSFAGIPNTYSHLQLRVALNTTGAISEFVKFWYNNDTTTTNYANHIIYGNGSSAGTFASTSSSSRGYHLYQVANGWSQPLTAVIDVLDYANTSKYRTTRLLYGSNDNGGGRDEVGLSSGLYMSTTAVNQINFGLSSGGNFPQHSQFSLYGVK